MRLPLRTLPVPIAAVSLSPSCSCLMAPMALALILGWCLVAASRAQHQPPPSLSLHPSQGVSVGDTVTLRCHLPQQAAWVQLWFNGTLRSDKEKDKEQDTVEFSLVVTNLEDAGTYQCRYQVSEPLWTSNMSDPMELVVTEVNVQPLPCTTIPLVGHSHLQTLCWDPGLCWHPSAKGPSHGNLVVAVVRGCVAVFVFCLGLYFVLDARSLWTQRDESPGVPPGMTEAVQIQVPSSDSEDLTYAEMQDATPCSQPSTSHTALQSPVIYTKVSTGLPC
ncbi:V-set and transmembrane domain-containing protein 1-like isoform X1 [Numida meleagris]|uniref:V-set and transmembrane domain-containing protein 1-like isoform X1 n=1 Tax=Numida meleagris TaxID=8996 RepID=UPI000B3D7F91|nr:V-set and transmembrane domain-containing protein 1-like isoform X1 [Numida meleagris]